MSTDWNRIAFFVIAIVAGVLATIFGQPLIHGNDMAINIIVTVFSILAGFLVAIMTIMGEPGIYAGRTWRGHEINRINIFNRLVRQKWMFYLYLVTLGLIFIASLIGKAIPELAVWIEKIYMGTATAAFILSLRLPVTLMDIQLARHEEIIQSKRKACGIKD